MLYCGFANAKVFTVLDTKNGFWHLHVSPLSRYRLLCMPFGIKSASDKKFQHRQHGALQDLSGTEVIVDDILIFGSGDTLEEAIQDHDRNLI